MYFRNSLFCHISNNFPYDMPTTFDKKEKKENEFLIFLLFEVLNRIHETSNFTEISLRLRECICNVAVVKNPNHCSLLIHT